jgi:DNA-binding LacI/PurR family transcriptional regulator
MASTAPLPLALLIDSLDDEYQVAVVRGALSAARALGVALLCVPGGRVRDPVAERAARNIVFDLVNAETVGGVVAVTSVIGSAIGPLELEAWLERFRGLPLCCVGIPIPGHVSVDVDNSGGIRELVLHLAKVHGRKHIAFVRGPTASAEASVRFQAFRDALEEAGLPFDPRLAAPGDFFKASGRAAVDTLLQDHRPPHQIDALVAANDYMALGAMEELWRRHVAVPDDIAVVGFDDVDSARFARPALATVSQPSEQLGRHGVEAAFKMAEGRTPPSTSLPTKLVLRSSCGCSSAEIGLASNVGLSMGRGVETSFVQRRHAILAEMARAAAGRLGAAGSGWDALLLDGLIADLRGGSRASCFRSLEGILQKLEHAPVAGLILQDVLTALRRQSLPCVASVPKARDQLEEILNETRVLVSIFSEQAVERRTRTARERQRTFENTMRSALFSNTAELSQAAAETLPELGLDACVVAALDEPDDRARGARLLFGFGGRDRISVAAPTQINRLPAHPLLEHGGRVRVLLPLVAFGRTLGAAVVTMARVPDDELEQLREFLGMALDILRHMRDRGRAVRT